MAYTDAISVCCKLLGMGADVYWSGDRTKYTTSSAADASASPQGEARGERTPRNAPQKPPARPQALVCERCGKEITGGTDAAGKPYSAFAVAKKSMDRFGKKMCAFCAQEAAIRQNKAAADAFAQQDAGDAVPPWEG
jgi:hypothetical protein